MGVLLSIVIVVYESFEPGLPVDVTFVVYSVPLLCVPPCVVEKRKGWDPLVECSVLNL